MLTNRTIAYRLIFVFTLLSAFVLTAIIGYSDYQSRKVLKRELENNARNLVLGSINKIETVLSSVGKVTEGMVNSLETGSHSEHSVNTLLNRTLEGNKEIFGICAAFEPDAPGIPTKPFAPYFYRKEGQTLFMASGNSFDYLAQDWYRKPRELGRKVWSEPYFDKGGGEILMTTCSIPFFDSSRGTRRVQGIVSSDISLEWLTEFVASIKVLRTGHSFLLSKDGVILSHPSREMIMKNIFDIAESKNDQDLRDIGRKMVRSESGFTSYTDMGGVKNWWYFAPVSSTGWTLAVVFPEEELFAEVRALTLKISLMGLAGMLLLSAAVAVMARSITAPLRTLAEATKAVASGNFDVEIPPALSKDEVGTLTQAFISMNKALKEYIKNLTETTAAKEHIQSELRVAREIQMSLVPKMYPKTPDWPHCELFASLRSAREVGGDLYDFFLSDDGKLVFAIGDVSDKGVPAALFMAVTKTLLKALSKPGQQPHELLELVNREIAEENDSLMFITLFCGKLDFETGELLFSNAGHNPPLLVRQGKDVEWLKLPKGFVLGPDLSAKYRTERIVLQPGDSLVTYTDGVTEAMNPHRKLYSEARLMETVRAAANSNPADFVNIIAKSVDAYAAGEPQSDDITLLALRYRA